jgi:hypothetical protein
MTDQKGQAIPYFGSVLPGVQIVPSFKGFNYVNPNYNSLTIGSCANTYPTINDGYVDKDCVKYIPRLCPKSKNC